VGALARVSPEQSFGVFGREPAAIFGDADGNDLVFRLIDCVKDGRGRKQRNFVLAAASAKENADSNLFYCHANSSLALGVFSVNPMAGYGGAKATTDTGNPRGHRGDTGSTGGLSRFGCHWRFCIIRDVSTRLMLRFENEQEICINLLTPRGNGCEIGVLPRPVRDPSPRHRAFEVLIKENCQSG
jgi:hypothetical protein